MERANLLIKPVSARCNMACSYCFYSDLAKHFSKLEIMKEEDIPLLLDWLISSLSPSSFLSITFQGGEPTLIGLSFYRRFVLEVERRNKKNIRVTFSLQTNGYNITEEWALFFKEKGFLLGISLDGNEDVHNRYRLDKVGNKSFSRVLESIRILEKYGVPYNVLSVITHITEPLSWYRFFKRSGIRHLQFIPCLDNLGEINSREYSLKTEDYTNFLVKVFPLWFRDWKNGNYISIRFFEEIINKVLEDDNVSCSITGECGRYLVLEADGTLYPCDFFVLDEWKIGKFNEYKNYEEALNSTQMKRFISSHSEKSEACLSCRWKNICNGGCPRYRRENNAIYCTSYKEFFGFAYDEILECAEKEKRFRALYR